RRASPQGQRGPAAENVCSSEVEPEEEVSERVPELPAAAVDDGWLVATAEASAEVEAQDERAAEGHAQAAAVAAPDAGGMLLLEPAGAGIGEEAALDTGQAQRAGGGGECHAVQDGETPLGIYEPDAGPGHGVARVAAQHVGAAEDGAAGDGAIAEIAEAAD